MFIKFIRIHLRPDPLENVSKSPSFFIKPCRRKIATRSDKVSELPLNIPQQKCKLMLNQSFHKLLLRIPHFPLQLLSQTLFEASLQITQILVEPSIIVPLGIMLLAVFEVEEPTYADENLWGRPMLRFNNRFQCKIVGISQSTEGLADVNKLVTHCDGRVLVNGLHVFVSSVHPRCIEKNQRVRNFIDISHISVVHRPQSSHVALADLVHKI
mmetsp:Transcript_13375/g.49686  ORF Transcript_13375/g.49686 Transcript_13375/m.49686 type:complete len:212 (+) Transcript_13375:379-1014(+)